MTHSQAACATALVFPSPSQPLQQAGHCLGFVLHPAESHWGHSPWGQQLQWRSHGRGAAPSPASTLSHRETEALSRSRAFSAEGTSWGVVSLEQGVEWRLRRWTDGDLGQCRMGGVVLFPPQHALLSPADSTDFQESFVTSGVFSVTELIQVSRSECDCDATAQPSSAWAQQCPNSPPHPTVGWGSPPHQVPLTPLFPCSTSGDGHRAKLLPGGAAGPPGL